MDFFGASDDVDIEFLKEEIGDVLALAISEAMMRKPDNPIEFIGKYLLKHGENMNRRRELEEKAREIAELKERHRLEELKKAEAKKHELEVAKEAAELAQKLSTSKKDGKKSKK
ncbi:hypothetical protein ADUPG1_013585 [Aduncisulcus paluster]|uniref:Uncharacterized protein n=1 Tax=Aduncisulcus paluster TaxID=2918883 RepID=A0ABQ5K888_9EUKA|nr:hypothetical protein ADUPG1_013585 [Aduncisulcus paluster]|eukprot:gnl/Carplike_NY0171/17630_a27165_97.p1 GENE.gnl/Carplike_NY0171/17630_a27165_97~~gnl/Carplike_NY0171/17630_a27165_97.p1  ORF type:complete len:114 (-),score=41.03 gnl/Carplike_NY0171/17630_a27165_97:158-499(-)